MFSLVRHQRNMEFWRDMRNLFLLPQEPFSSLSVEVKSPQKQQPKDERARSKKTQVGLLVVSEIAIEAVLMSEQSASTLAKTG